MTEKQKRGYIEKFLNRSNKAIDRAVEQGVRKADEILDEAVDLGKITIEEAQRRSDSTKSRAKRKAESLKAQGERRLRRSVEAAKKMSIRQADAIETLERLGALRKAGIITEKEFREKKTKLLARI